MIGLPLLIILILLNCLPLCWKCCMH